MNALALKPQTVGAIRRFVDQNTSRHELKQFLLEAGAKGERVLAIAVTSDMRSRSYKSKADMVDASPDNPRLRWRVLSHASPKEYAEVMRKRGNLPLNEWLPMLERIQPSARDWEGDPNVPEASRVGSLAVGAIKSVPTVKEFIDSMIKEAEELAEKWEWIKGR